MGSLVAAYTVAWVVLMIYVVTLAARQRRLRAEVAKLEAQMETTSAVPAPAPEAAHAQ